VFIALCVLTACSFFTYSEVWRTHVPPKAGWAFMMAVAVCKALLVASFFMHLRWEASWKYVLTLPTIGMAVFLMLALIPDIGMRRESYDAERRAAEALPAPANDPHAAAHGAPMHTASEATGAAAASPAPAH
ncbi:MAG TPA: cytochrome C oxidase subunit IV family protein, partial [Pirellulales bacterium]